MTDILLDYIYEVFSLFRFDECLCGGRQRVDLYPTGINRSLESSLTEYVETPTEPKIRE